MERERLRPHARSPLAGLQVGNVVASAREDEEFPTKIWTQLSTSKDSFQLEARSNSTRKLSQHLVGTGAG